jgi:uncharacterized Tic20 family protein
MTKTADAPSDFASRTWMKGARRPGTKIDAAQAWRIGCHLAPLLFWVLTPYGSAVVIPLLIWQMKARKEGDTLLAFHAVEALNFQISLTLLCIGLSITIIGLLVVPVVMLAGLVFSIMASYKTYRGEEYRYPWTYRFIKE